MGRTKTDFVAFEIALIEKHISTREKFRRALKDGRTLEESGDFFMRYLIRRARKKDKYGVRSEATPLPYIYTAMYLGEEIKGSRKTPGMIEHFDEGRKPGGVEGPEPAVTLKGDEIQLAAEMRDKEM